jgi:lysophospholipase L1-like esterase
MIKPHDVILFQGDSITDCGRSRETAGSANELSALGQGYAKMISAEQLSNRPGDGLRFFNRGISGNRIVDLYARIRLDIINLEPNLLSILIGVNDTWHEFAHPGKNGVAVPKFERVYRDLLNEIREALPAVKFVLCEPFVLNCGVVTADWVEEITRRRAVVAKLAKELDAVFVPFQSMFDDALKLAPPEYWAGDGVHPSAAGHFLMAKTWIKAVGI